MFIIFFLPFLKERTIALEERFFESQLPVTFYQPVKVKNKKKTKKTTHVYTYTSSCVIYRVSRNEKDRF